MAIFTHVTLGTNDYDKAVAFYDAALAALGIDNLGNLHPTAMMYGKGAPEFVILTPSDGNSACSANGGTIGFAAENRAQVHKFHEAGLAAGGTDAGEPGPRSFAPNAYASYLRDPDGNKICAYSFTEE
ncbi:VOC family protein [Gammaproteobacteria bacterium]|nr:VOC family protein [Gammaproteobacteria bacterium]